MITFAAPLLAAVLLLYGVSVVSVTCTVFAYRRKARPLDNALSASLVAVLLAGVFLYYLLLS